MQQMLRRGSLHGFGGVIDQVDDDALELFGVDLHGDRPVASSTRRSMPSRRPRKTDKAFLTISLRSLGTGWAAGKRENWENSSARVFTDSTSREMVRAHSRRVDVLSAVRQ